MKARFPVLFCGLSSILKAQFFGPHAAFPPPFQWVYLIVQMVYNIKKKEASKREERNVMDKKKKYFDCLKEVIQVKKLLHSDLAILRPTLKFVTCTNYATGEATKG